MYIQSLIIKNYRAIEDIELKFNNKLNLIVGDNEVGKSTLLEAIGIGLTGQLNGRSLQSELHPYLFNAATAQRYLCECSEGKNVPPPSILIELYFADDPALAALSGNNNSKRAKATGASITIELDEDFQAEFAKSVASPDTKNIPIEYYQVAWRSFAGKDLKARNFPLRATLIDASANRNHVAANKYVLDIADEFLKPEQKVSLAISYRKLKDLFLNEPPVEEINKELATKKGRASQRTISLALDTTSRAGWQAAVMAHLDEIPLPLVGKGEQNCVKIKLAVESSTEDRILLIEEPENHLSFPNLSNLIGYIANHGAEKQAFITTHSSFVLNKLGIDNVILFTGKRGVTLKSLTVDTQDYFLKLPGHDTLRMILGKRSILVEGPSDELIVQRAHKDRWGCLPLERQTDVICVKSLAFKRFLEIAKLLHLDVRVVTDNDGNTDALKKKYEDFSTCSEIRICYDLDTNYKTLEPQLVKVNGLGVMNEVLGTTHSTEIELLAFMEKNKTECALRIFSAPQNISFPQYILDAIS